MSYQSVVLSKISFYYLLIASLSPVITVAFALQYFSSSSSLLGTVQPRGPGEKGTAHSSRYWLPTPPEA